MQNRHPKRKIARLLRSKQESRDKVPIFQTKGWEARKVAIASRVAMKQNKSLLPPHLPRVIGLKCHYYFWLSA